MRTWSLPERVLLLVVIVFAVLAVVRLAVREPAPVVPSTQQPAVPGQVAREPAPAGGASVGAAAAELLARIRSCSAKELEGIVDRMSAAEALGLYQKLPSADRQAVFAALPAPVLARKAQEILGIPENGLRHARRPGLLASALVDAAMGAAADAPDPHRQTLCFATALDGEQAPTGPRSTFRPGERRIYACLEARVDADIDVPAADAGVLVRWTAEATGGLVYLHYLPFNVNRRWNHVYFEAADVWAPGTYRVRFYRVTEPAALVAEGTYVVGMGD